MDAVAEAFHSWTGSWRTIKILADGLREGSIGMVDTLGFVMTLISFCVSMAVARLVFRHKSFSFLSNRQGRHQSLDGLRGFLAIAVFFHHFILTWYWKVNDEWGRPPQDYYENYGKAGVALFFMVTGFLFISKILQQEGNINWFNLYESRVFRIFPLYIFAVIIITFATFYHSSYELNVSFLQLIKQYMSWGVFHGGVINDFANTRRVIAGVDWTLKYEWLFYISLPILAVILVKLGRAGGFILLVICALLFLKPIYIYSITTVFFIFFALGGLAAFTSQNIRISESIIKNKITSSVTGLVIILTLFYPKTFDSFHVILIFIIFILVILGNDLFGIFSLKSSVLLGEISYSIYLLHGAVLYFLFTICEVLEIHNFTLQMYLLFMPLISIIVILVSSLTFILIERPGLKLGRKYYVSRLLMRVQSKANKTGS